jgi:hypothetical protein
LKRKVGILNIWQVNNYGAFFLAYALEKVISRMGYEAVTVAWSPDEVRWPWKPSMIKKIGLKAYIMRLGFFMLYYLPRQLAFRNIRKKLITTKKRYNDKTVCDIADIFDKIVVGGDQLWSTKPTMYNTNYFLPWILEKEKKVCYAASIAQPDIREEIRDEFVRNVRNFGYVTSREDWSKKLIKRYSTVDAPRVCDPIFLISPEQWRSLQIPDERLANKKFIFVYQIEITLSMIELAEKLSEDTGYEVIYCPFPLKKQIKCRRKPYISPERWLWYVDKAKYVITDSFHGLAFSICLNTPFFSQIALYNAPTSSRITNILDVYSLQNRLVNNDNNYSKESIDWKKVNETTTSEKNNSMEHLKKMLEM